MAIHSVKRIIKTISIFINSSNKLVWLSTTGTSLFVGDASEQFGSVRAHPVHLQSPLFQILCRRGSAKKRSLYRRDRSITTGHRFPCVKKSACSSSGRLNCFLHGKSSDLWIILGRAFPGSLPVTLMRLCPQIQQRDCSGFAPDSLLGQSLQPAPQKRFNYAVIIT